MIEHRAPVPWTPALVRVMAGLMISMLVAAIDSNAVATAVPTVARDLGGFELYPWIFSGYLLTSTTSVPLWGRLADLHGRKSVLLVGLAVFVAGSVLCGLSANMYQLILFRTVQGIGAGCLLPIVFTVVGDIFPVAQRARLQGLFSAMWGISAVTGPAVGATFVSTIGWRWIFDINLPIGVVAAFLLWGYRERRESSPGERLDVRGAVLLTLAIAFLLYGLGSGAPGGRPIWPVAAVGGLGLVAFAAVELRSAHPTVPLDLLRHSVIGPAILVGAISGTVMFGETAYVPLYVQQVLHGSAYAAGASIAPMSLGWPVASVIAGLLLVRLGYQRLLVAGAVGLIAGSLLLQLGPEAYGVAWVGAATAVVGFGMGLFSAPLVIVIQANVPWARRGAATALNQFARTIGGAVGVALMGILVQQDVAASANPLAATRALDAGLHSIFLVLSTLAVGVLLVAVAILAQSRGAGERTAPAEAAS